MTRVCAPTKFLFCKVAPRSGACITLSFALFAPAQTIAALQAPTPNSVQQNTPMEKLCAIFTTIPKGLKTAPRNLEQCGEAYERGDGTPQDYKQAAFFFRKGADQGDVLSQDHLGWLYLQGWGVQYDPVQSAYWVKKSAEQGDTWAQRVLGLMYENATGVPQDDFQAADWLEKAAAQGDQIAQESLPDVQRKLRDRRNRELILAGKLCACFALVTVVIVYWRKIFGLLRRLIPRTTAQKQLAVLMPVALWCSGCCLFEVLRSDAMRHPINAAVTAALLAAPAIVLGALAFWWLSQNAKREAAP